MLIIPAIDIKDGRCVRLLQGDPTKTTVYADDPVDMARHWVSRGARRLHIVDLDGAILGGIRHQDLLLRMKQAAPVVIEFGGGVRRLETVRDLIRQGVDRVIVGTAIVNDDPWVRQAIQEFPDRLMAAIDAVDGDVKKDGWQKKSGVSVEEAVRKAESLGFKEFIFTDISKDGMLQGPNIRSIESVLRITTMGLYASGGIAHLEDLQALKKIKGISGCIIGKALYAKQFTLEEALSL
ncbi:MAG TPA: 1-(5-phosphoribosyl)-5-[(5-phosphoribosylamino)methylideneamino]imidazole-4-carboxamide isomerase [Elusimicrobiota bacterium]|nr:1-(5-phosphoribosyl)-5-[(5-phosphoribosylamino)methylideneamino]imidazole-4-carboxamide isomerase [Elusimicrobiota bacterium]